MHARRSAPRTRPKKPTVSLADYTAIRDFARARAAVVQGVQAIAGRNSAWDEWVGLEVLRGVEIADLVARDLMRAPGRKNRSALHEARKMMCVCAQVYWNGPDAFREVKQAARRRPPDETDRKRSHVLVRAGRDVRKRRTLDARKALRDAVVRCGSRRREHRPRRVNRARRRTSGRAGPDDHPPDEPSRASHRDGRQRRRRS